MRGLRIKGQFFAETTEIDLFGSKTNNGGVETESEKQIAVLYGKNGSGKTTISNAFLSFSNDNEETFEIVELFDINKNIIPTEEIGEVFVFNESFTNKNVTLSSDDGLNAIMLFGKTGEIDEKINHLLNNIKTEEDKIRLIDIEKYHRKPSNYCIDEAKESVIGILKNGWALREQTIKGNVKKSPVKPEIVNMIQTIDKPKETKASLDETFRELIKRIESVKGTNEKLGFLVFDCPLKPVEDYNNLLCISLNKKEMTEFAGIVLKTIQTTNSQYLDLSKDVLSHEGVCPVCFQSISLKHGNEMTEIINDIFDDSVEKLKTNIKNEVMEPIQIPDFLEYSKYIDKKIIEQLKTTIEKCNEAIEIINGSLKLKIGSIYNPAPKIDIDTVSLIDTLEKSLSLFNEEIKRFNDSVEKKRC